MAEPVLASEAQRPAVLRELEAERFDLLVVGGGITGAGVAREAARRGLRVALLEAHDFAAGTSSRSTKLVHGGLRYLAQGDVRLVREGALERKAIHRIAPHLAEPLWMVLPSEGALGALGWRAAIAVYERLGAVAAAERHRSWSRAELALEEPLLAPRWRRAAVYREYRTDDARLVLACLRAAVAEGASALSYAPLRALRADGAQGVVAEAQCALSGAELRVRARAAVNAAGPWAGAVRGLAQPQGARPWLHLTRGIHVALPHARLPLHNMVMLRAQDGRLLFAIPRPPVVYVGTTDTTHAGPPELWPQVPLAEVEYLLEALPRYFSIAPVRPDEIVASWAGLRPLIAQPGRRPSEISRRDELQLDPGPLLSIAGGKLTGYRAMARAVLGALAPSLGWPLAAPGEEPPLPGGELGASLGAAAAQLAQRAGLRLDVAERLLRLYGAESAQVLALGSEALCSESPVRVGEIEWATSREGALALEDVFYRRTRAALYEPAASHWIEPMASRMAKLLSWTEARRAAEVERVRRRRAADLEFCAQAPARPHT
jgi:glycerol-3-phosphate dehydrogenase